MPESDEWSKKQSQPLQLFDLAAKWTDAIKVVGAGNATGVLAAGAALPTFAKYPTALIVIKVGGVCFLFGVLTFACAFAYLQLAVLQHDNMLHAVRDKNETEARRLGASSSFAMTVTNWSVVVSAFSFLLGLLVAAVAFLTF